MASLADQPTVRGRVDRAGHLIAADRELEDVHRDAGGVSGGLLALPQLAAITRLAFRLGVPIERPAILAAVDHDVHCWVRAVPQGDEAAIELENWSQRGSREARFDTFVDDRPSTEAAGTMDLHWACDPELKLTEISAALAAIISMDSGDVTGVPFTKLFRLIESEDGEMPILNALAARSDFVGQAATARADANVDLLIDGTALLDSAGRFSGFRGHASTRSQGAATRSAAGSPTASAPNAAMVGPNLEEILRQPIERIVAEAEKISDRSDGPLRSDYAGYGGDIAAAARHLLSVLSTMGDDPEFGRGQIDVTALAAEAVVLVEPIAEDRKVSVVLDNSPALQASGEEHAVIQILVNLLVNAVRHSPEGSTVTIGFAKSEGWAAIAVADQGVGIAPEDHKRIFERFERADEQPGGTGLGLAIARRLARSMGGEVALESEPGRGAKFTLSLPAS